MSVAVDVGLLKGFWYTDVFSIKGVASMGRGTYASRKVPINLLGGILSKLNVG